MQNILNVWQKELLDIIRDRKGMRQSLLIPLVIGVFYAVINPLLGTLISSSSDDVLVLPVQGLEYADEDFIETFTRFGIELEPFEGDMEAAIVRAEEPAGLIFSEGFGDNIAEREAATLIVRTNSTAGGPFQGGISLNRLELALTTYNQQITVERLTEQGVDLSVLAPVTLDSEDLATPVQIAGSAVAFFLPILIVTSAVAGGQFIAIDVTAGEKERGTLEALLVTPAKDWEIFIGKLLAVFVITAVPIVLTLVGFWATTLVLPESMTNGAGALPLAVIGIVLLLTLPLALFVDVILMVLSIRTRDFKSAQSAISPVVMGGIFVSMAAAFVPPTASLPFLIPVYGTAAVVGTLSTGGVIPANAVLFSVLGCLVGTAVGILIALPMFNRERLLYTV
ncbi:MAG: ABC transporter permease subunit [Chloroflexota bacterium]